MLLYGWWLKVAGFGWDIAGGVWRCIIRVGDPKSPKGSRQTQIAIHGCRYQSDGDATTA